MSKPRMGDMLRRMGKLSTIDVDEILVEQSVSPRRFGEIAVSWGLCEPADICEAWCVQFATDEEIDLSLVGIDPAAAGIMPPSVAIGLGVMPLRLIGNQVIIATSRELDSVETTEVTRAVRRDARFVLAPAEQIALGVEHFYGTASEVAAA